MEAHQTPPAGPDQPPIDDETRPGAPVPDDAPPALDDDTPPPADDPPAAGEPTLPKGRVRIPEDTRGHYVVLWARKPARGQRPSYEEVVCIQTHDVASAKRKAMDDPATGEFLKARAAEKPGILLRAVPAMHWPQDVEPTTYVRPDPILQIG